MFISSMVFALAATQSGALPAKRDAFVNCMKQEMVKALDDEIIPSEFTANFAEKCITEQAEYRSAMIASDRRGGSSEADATEFADEEIAYMRERFYEDYVGYHTNGDRPVF